MICRSDNSRFGNRIHGRSAGSLQRCSALQRLLGFVGTPVWNDNDIFHGRDFLVQDTQPYGTRLDLGQLGNLLNGQRRTPFSCQMSHDD